MFSPSIKCLLFRLGFAAVKAVGRPADSTSFLSGAVEVLMPVGDDVRTGDQCSGKMKQTAPLIHKVTVIFLC